MMNNLVEIDNTLSMIKTLPLVMSLIVLLQSSQSELVITLWLSISLLFKLCLGGLGGGSES